MLGPTAAAVASTSSTPCWTIPAAIPRQPQWIIATPRGPASATGRQSATKTRGVSPGRSVAWPSASGRPGAGSANALGSVGSVVALHEGLVHLAADQDAARVDLERGGEPVAVLAHPGVAGEAPEVERVEGRLADPAEPGAERGHARRGARPRASARRPSPPSASRCSPAGADRGVRGACLRRLELRHEPVEPVVQGDLDPVEDVRMRGRGEPWDLARRARGSRPP